MENGLDFRQAEQFLAVVDHGGIGRAAEALGLSQPAVSQTIRALERSTGALLFHRVGRGLMLTPEGRSLVRPLRRLLRGVDAARSSISEVTGVLGGQLEISAIGASFDRLVPVVGAFRRRHPQVRVRLECPDVEREVVAAVQERRCELGFLPLPWTGYDAAPVPPLTTGVVTERWGFDDVVLVLPPGEYGRLPDPIAVEALPELPIVAVPDGAYARVAVEAELRRARVRTEIAVTTGHRDMLMPLVLRGVGMAFTLAEYGRAAAQQGAILRHLTPTIRVGYGVAHLELPPSPTARAFLDLARDRLADS